MKRFYFFILAGSILLLAGCATQKTEQLPRNILHEKDYINASVFVQAMSILKANYVNGEKATGDKLFEAALHGMASLDQYSGYEPPKDFKRQNDRRSGETSGIGISVVKIPGKFLYILDVVPRSPAARSGIKPGDNIQSINGKDIRKLNLFQCQKLLQGPQGTKVTVNVISGKKISKKTLIRKKVVFPSVTAAKVINDHIGYIRISSFTPHTPLEFHKALKKIKKELIDALIIDLRNNSGGHVKATVKTLSQLLPPEKLLFSATRRNQQKTEEIRSKKLRNIQPDVQTPIILLANNFTASSAEIFAGALRDNKRADIVGSKTFGKGTLLHVVRLANGGALRFSSGKYKTPAGTEIEGKGLKPDYNIQLSIKQMQRLALQGKRFPGIIKPDGKNTLTDRQLEKAVELLTETETTDSIQNDKHI